MNYLVKLLTVLLALLACQRCLSVDNSQGKVEETNSEKSLKEQITQIQKTSDELFRKRDTRSSDTSNKLSSSYETLATKSKDLDTVVLFDHSRSPSKKETKDENADRDHKLGREQNSSNQVTKPNQTTTKSTGNSSSGSENSTPSPTESCTSKPSEEYSSSSSLSSPPSQSSSTPSSRPSSPSNGDHDYDVPKETAPVYSSSSKKIRVFNHQKSSYSSNSGTRNQAAHSDSASTSGDEAYARPNAYEDQEYPAGPPSKGEHESEDYGFPSSESNYYGQIDNDEPKPYRDQSQQPYENSVGESELFGSPFDVDEDEQEQEPPRENPQTGYELQPPVNEKVQQSYIDTSDPSDPKQVHVEKEVKSHVGPNSASHEHRESKVSTSLGGNSLKSSKRSSSFSSNGHSSISGGRMLNFAGGAFSSHGYHEDPTDFTAASHHYYNHGNNFGRLGERVFPRIRPLAPLKPLPPLKPRAMQSYGHLPVSASAWSGAPSPIQGYRVHPDIYGSSYPSEHEPHYLRNF